MTPGNALKIGQMELSPTAGNPFVFEGVHSGGQLSGIEVAVTVYSSDDAHAVDELFERDSVTVDDPFTNRQYEAALHGKSSMYQEGRPGTTYRFEVKELDEEAPQFKQLEIEGHTFTVIRNSESLYSKDSVIGTGHIAAFIARGISDISRVTETRAHHDPTSRHRRKPDCPPFRRGSLLVFA